MLQLRLTPHLTKAFSPTFIWSRYAEEEEEEEDMEHPVLDHKSACPHGRYWDICKERSCAKKFQKFQNDNVVAVLLSAAKRHDENEMERKLMPPPTVPRGRENRICEMLHELSSQDAKCRLP